MLPCISEKKFLESGCLCPSCGGNEITVSLDTEQTKERFCQTCKQVFVTLRNGIRRSQVYFGGGVGYPKLTETDVESSVVKPDAKSPVVKPDANLLADKSVSKSEDHRQQARAYFSS